jgi:hypothetical protein
VTKDQTLRAVTVRQLTTAASDTAPDQGLVIDGADLSNVRARADCSAVLCSVWLCAVCGCVQCSAGLQHFAQPAEAAAVVAVVARGWQGLCRELVLSSTGSFFETNPNTPTRRNTTKTTPQTGHDRRPRAVG